MANIKQTDLLRYLANKFNDNSFGIPFKMGTYEPYADANDQVHLFIYAPQNPYNGHFDERYQFSETTYQVDKTNFVVMSGGISSGEYTPLPDHQLVSYDVTVSFLVFVDNPISEIIRLAIEEVRDSLIGNLDTLEIKEIDLTDESESATLITDYLRLATTADSIVFGDINEIMGRRYMEYSLTVTMTVSKNVELGNQFQWEIAKYTYTYSWQLTNDELKAPYDQDVANAGLLTTPTREGLRARVGSVGSYVYYKSIATQGTATYYTVIPLIADFGTTQDLESFQTLRSMSVSNDKYKQVHNYVKSRGYAMVFTFLFDSTNYIIRELFKETFTVLDSPNKYSIRMKFKELDTDGTYIFETDMQRTTDVILEEASPNEIVYGEPITFTVGFSVSAK